MSTIGSPEFTRKILLLIISIVFIIGCVIFIDGVVEIIDLRTNDFEYNLAEEAEKLEQIEDTISTNFTAIIEDRFPSTGAPSVILIFGVITIIESILGSVAVNKINTRLLSALSIVLVIGFFIRFVFFISTVCMYAFTIDYNPIRFTTILSGVVAIVQLITIPLVCHFAKAIKRGDPKVLEQIERQTESET